MSKLYRFYTEDINQEQVYKLISRRCAGATFFSAKGYWNNLGGEVCYEDSLVIEVIETADWYPQARLLKAEIQDANKQESVLLTVSSLESSEIA